MIRVEEFLNDPWGARVSGCGTVQFPVPKVVPVPAGYGGGNADAADEAAAFSAQAKRLALQRKATTAMSLPRIMQGGLNLEILGPPQDILPEMSMVNPMRMLYAECAFWVKAKEVREGEGFLPSRLLWLEQSRSVLLPS